MKQVWPRITCRACKKRNLVKVLDFGKTPPANAFQKTLKDENWFPLQVNLCMNCGMVQLAHVVNPKLLFENYVYVSSTSPAFVLHFAMLAKEMKKFLRLRHNSLIIDIGSNDGILLKPFKKLGMRILGVEPAKNIARRANREGIPTKPNFFNWKLAKRIVKQHGQADLITATNVFAHIDNLDEVLEGIKILLKPEGIFLVEVAYLGDLLKHNYFDLIYHEHLCYWAVMPMKRLAERLGMKFVTVQHVDTHGGSIRVLMQLESSSRRITTSVDSFIRREKKLGLNKLCPYKALSKRVRHNKKQLQQLLSRLKKQEKIIVGFGAPAKSTTLLNYFKIDKRILDYIVDDSIYKQGLYTPGTQIPVVAPEIMYQKQPNYVLILAWNFAKSIMEKHRSFKKFGGKFIIPFPAPRIV